MYLKIPNTIIRAAASLTTPLYAFVGMHFTLLGECDFSVSDFITWMGYRSAKRTPEWMSEILPVLDQFRADGWIACADGLPATITRGTRIRLTRLPDWIPGEKFTILTVDEYLHLPVSVKPGQALRAFLAIKSGIYKRGGSVDPLSPEATYLATSLLASHLGVTEATASKITDALVASGLLARHKAGWLAYKPGAAGHPITCPIIYALPGPTAEQEMIWQAKKVAYHYQQSGYTVTGVTPLSNEDIWGVPVME